MKKTCLALITGLLLATGCNKCYQCNGLGEVCKGDAMYEEAQHSAKYNTTFTDYNGQTLYKCK